MATATLSRSKKPDWKEAQIHRPDDFPPDVFTTIPNVPVFSEHETTTKKGRRLVFGRRELELICRRCNRRIQETGDYAVICIGHTPDPVLVQTGLARMPEVIGYGGPWRMGTLQQPGEQPRSVILCDFHIFNEDLPRLKKFPRRSPELWVEERYEDMFLDPIAILGHEPPRLDQGMLYCAWSHRGAEPREVERYTAVAPAATNCFIPRDVERADNPQRHCAAQPTEEGSFMLSPEDVNAVVGALMETPVFQWAKAKMESEASPAASAGAEPPAPPPAAPAADAEKNNAGTPVVPEPSVPPVPQPPATPPEPEKNSAVKKFRADDGEEIEVDADGKITSRTHASLPDSPNDEPTKYSRLYQQVTTLESTVKSLQGELQTERAARVDAQRFNVLQALAHSGYQIDPHKYLEKMCYSKMNAQQFDDQISLIRELGARAPLNMSLPVFDDPASFDPAANGSTGTEKYSREHSDRAREICEQAALEGKEVDYKAVLEKVRRGESVTV